MTVAPQAETEVVSGVIAGIVAKGGDKYQVAVQPPGSQYTKNLWTKDVNLVAGLQQMIGQHTSFLCGVSHWTNNQNQPVRSLWINGVGPEAAAVAQAPVAASPPPQPVAPGFPAQAQPPQHVVVQPQAFPMQPMQQPMQQPVAQMQPRYDDRENKIHRQTATKVAVDLLKFLEPQHHTFDTLITLSERLVAYYEHGVGQAQAPDLPQDGNPGHGHPGGPGYGWEPGMDPGQPTNDDDIPF
jgi:hypothetical protein